MPRRRVLARTLQAGLTLALALPSSRPAGASQLPNHMRVAQRALVAAPAPIRELVGPEGSDTWRAYLAGAVALDGLGLRAEAAEAVHGFEFSGHDHERIHELLENAYRLARADGSAAEQAFVLGLVTHFWLDVHEHALVNRFGGYYVSDAQKLRHKQLETLETEHVYLLGDVPLDRAHLVPAAASVPVGLLDRAIDSTFGADDRFLGGDIYYQGQEGVVEAWLALHLADEGEYRRSGQTIDRDGGVRRSVGTGVGLAKLPRLPLHRDYERIRTPLSILRLAAAGVRVADAPGAVRPGDAIAIEADFALYDRTFLRHYLDAWPEAIAAAEAAIARSFAGIAASGTLGLPEMNLDSGLPYGQEAAARERYARGIGSDPIDAIELDVALVGDAGRRPLVKRSLRIVDGDGDGTVELAGPQPGHPPIHDGGKVTTSGDGWEDQRILDPARYRETLVLPEDLAPGTYQVLLALHVGEGGVSEDDVETVPLVVGEAEGVETRIVLAPEGGRGRDLLVRVSVSTASGAPVDLGELRLAAPGGTVSGEGLHTLAGRDFGSTVVVRPAAGIDTIVLNALYTGDAIEDGIADRVFRQAAASLSLKTLDAELGDAAPGKPRGELTAFVDAAGNPVAGARVQATAGDPGHRRVYDLVAGEATELPEGHYQVRASAPFHAEASDAAEVRGEEPVTLHLHLVPNPGTLTVTVEDEASRPIPGARASVTGAAAAGPRPAPASFSLAPGAYAVHAEADGFLAQDSSPAEVEPGKPRAITLRLKPVPAREAARVWINPAWLELEPGDAAGVEVKVYDADNLEIVPTPAVTYLVTDPAVASVDAGGTVSGVRRGETQLVVACGSARGAIAIKVTSASPLYSCVITNNPGRLPAHGGGHVLRAEARDLDGKLVPEAVFEWTSSDFTVALVDPASGRVTTESQGRFTAIAVGRLGDGEATCFAEIEVGDSSATVLVIGRVLNADGTPAAGAQVAARGGPPGTADAAGVFTVLAGGPPLEEGARVPVTATLDGAGGSSQGTVADGRVSGVVVTLGGGAAAADPADLPGFLADAGDESGSGGGDTDLHDLPEFLADAGGGSASDDADPLLDWVGADPGSRPAADLGAQGEDLLDDIRSEETIAQQQKDRAPVPPAAEPAGLERVDPTEQAPPARPAPSAKPAKRSGKSAALAGLAGRVTGAILDIAAAQAGRPGRSLPGGGENGGGGGARVLHGAGTYRYEAGPGGEAREFQGSLSITIDVPRGTWSAEGSDTRSVAGKTFASEVSLSGSYRGDDRSGTLDGTLNCRITIRDEDGATSDDLPPQPIAGQLDGSHVWAGGLGIRFFDATVR